MYHCKNRENGRSARSFFREDPSTFCVLPYAKMWFWASRVTHSYKGLEACHWVSLYGGPLRNANRGEFPALAPKKKAQKKVSSLPLCRAALRKRKDSSEKNELSTGAASPLRPSPRLWPRDPTNADPRTARGRRGSARPGHPAIGLGWSPRPAQSSSAAMAAPESGSHGLCRSIGPRVG